MPGVDEVIELHDRVIAQSGGRGGLLSRDLLEAALARPFGGMADGTEFFASDLAKASVLFQSVIEHHAFTDGNKRTATILLLKFLEVRGLSLEVSDDEIVDQCVRIADHSSALDVTERWIRSHARPLVP